MQGGDDPPGPVEQSDADDVGAVAAARAEEALSRFLPQVSARMVDLMPILANLRVRRTWRGMYPMTPDGQPIIGWSSEERDYLLAIGMCGQGFMLGPGVGELVARMVILEADASRSAESRCCSRPDHFFHCVRGCRLLCNLLIHLFPQCFAVSAYPFFQLRKC